MIDQLSPKKSAVNNSLEHLNKCIVFHLISLSQVVVETSSQLSEETLEENTRGLIWDNRDENVLDFPHKDKITPFPFWTHLAIYGMYIHFIGNV